MAERRVVNARSLFVWYMDALRGANVASAANSRVGREAAGVNDDCGGGRVMMEYMKVGSVGAGAVGTACMSALTLRGSAREIVHVNRTLERARGAVADLRYGAVLAPHMSLRAGDYAELRGAAVVMITAGANEKQGGATDRSDPAGRLKLLATNAAVYRDIVPRVVAAAPDALLLVVTVPPDPLADVARRISGHNRVLSSSRP